MNWWVTFTDRKPACVDHGSEADARALASTVGTVKAIRSLPYPADPRLEPATSECPSFCYTPELCAGQSCCRKSYACSE